MKAQLISALSAIGRYLLRVVPPVLIMTVALFLWNAQAPSPLHGVCAWVLYWTSVELYGALKSTIR